MPDHNPHVVKFGRLQTEANELRLKLEGLFAYLARLPAQKFSTVSVIVTSGSTVAQAPAFNHASYIHHFL